MDGLYDNLENYEDLRIVEQLKAENMELKNKLEEYTKAMDTLQKDFDRVSSDFKKLEINYSSLLKTAKVEIERKTKIIQNLNIEKDMIVLKALQNNSIQDVRSLREVTKPFQKGPINDNFAKKTTNPSPDNLKVKCDSVRKEDNRFSSVDTVTSSNTDLASRLLKLASSNAESAELWSDRTSDTKENMAKKDVEDSCSTNTRALSIRSRRKSMPSVRSQVKLSSDEECEDTYCRNDAYKKCYPSKEDSIRQNVDKVYNDRHRHKGLEERNKVSESNVDNRYSGYELNRDTYHRNRSEKYVIDKYRSREKYDQRRRRYLSPERSRRPSRPEYQRQEYGRHRYLESPPPDKFYQHQQRNRESRCKLERDDLFNFDKRDHHQERHPLKHKANDNFDEPVSKRQRSDSFNRFPEDEKRWVREKGVPLEKTVSDLFDEMPQYTSCQSPDDYLLSEEGSPHYVKEIMNTASTPLEDPRTHSRKYILKIVDNNAELTTVTGRNVDLKKIDLSTWGFHQVDVPQQLNRSLPQCDDKIIREIYMDIENPISNMSAESGEVLSGTEEEPNKTVIHRKAPSMRPEGLGLDAADTDSRKLPTTVVNDLAKYKIPKINNISNKEKPVLISKIDSKKVISKSEQKITKNKTEACTDKSRLPERSKSFRSSLTNERKGRDSIAVAKEIVEGDLELSDETSDCYTENQANSAVTHTISQIPNIKVTDMDILTNKTRTGIEHDVKTDHINLSLDLIEKPVNTVQDEIKKHKSKKKTKAKEDKTEKHEQAPKKKDKGKKDKKTKFTELFGDSNSLVAPEDLGSNSLMSPHDLGILTQPQLINQYILLCEDAQDAVDVNVSEAATVKTLKPIEKHSETSIKKEVELPSCKSESKPKTKSKTVDETKKKKLRNSESGVVSVEQPRNSESPKNPISNVPNAEIPDLISPMETQPGVVSEVTEIEKPQQEAEDKPQPPKNVLNKPSLVENALMRALATSTPQKIAQQESPDVGTVAVMVEANNASGDAASADAAPAVETRAQDADVPDVRIFVKRRRRVIKKPS